MKAVTLALRPCIVSCLELISSSRNRVVLAAHDDEKRKLRYSLYCLVYDFRPAEIIC